VATAERTDAHPAEKILSLRGRGHRRTALVAMAFGQPPLFFIYTILKAPVSTVVMRHLFTNNPSQLFQINSLYAYRWPNGGPARARRTRATTMAQTRHVGLLTVPGQPVSPSAHLIKST
jgi:hypothetical protein